jgi:hypothetical protein
MTSGVFLVMSSYFVRLTEDGSFATMDVTRDARKLIELCQIHILYGYPAESNSSENTNYLGKCLIITYLLRLRETSVFCGPKTVEGPQNTLLSRGLSK